MTIETEAQAREFWAELDERSGLLLAKTAPRVAHQWAREFPGGCGEALVRHSADWESTVAEIKIGSDYHPRSPRVPINVCGVGLEPCDTVEEAKSACDARLREMGFVLEDGE